MPRLRRRNPVSRAVSLLTVLALGLCLGACGAPADGVIRGSLVRCGALLPEKSLRHEPGKVFLRTDSGKLLQSQYVRQGRDFIFKVPAGRYRLSSKLSERALPTIVRVESGRQAPFVYLNVAC